MGKEEIKFCSCCGLPFPKSCFGKNRQTPDGLAYYTKAHAAQKQKTFRVTHPEQVRDSRERYLNKLRERNSA